MSWRSLTYRGDTPTEHAHPHAEESGAVAAHHMEDGDNNVDSSNASIDSNEKETKRPDPPEQIQGDGIDHAEEDRVPWEPQNSTSTCEFTHTILDYSQKRESGCKKAEYSRIVQDERGNRWRLIIYVNGNGRASNHHLSLFLQVADADDLPFGWKKTVSYVLTLEHPSGKHALCYSKRNPDKTFKLCPKAIDWGWSQFITSDRIQQDGFIQNDVLIVRAHVSVKSSSVVIDEEDAELYLKCAVEDGLPDSVKLCLNQGASVNCQFKDDLYTPLHTACSTATGPLSVLNLLLNEGARCNANNKWKETPLLIAANNGNHAAVQVLLQRGANPSLCSEAGWSALTFAAHKGYDDIVALLLRAGAPINCPVTEDMSTPLHKACAGTKEGHMRSVRSLLIGGADVHALNKWRETPLLTAANHGQSEAVEALLEYEADACKCTDTGWSPLSIAAYKGHDECVRLLLEDGAPTEEEDLTLSALLQAATKGLPATVQLLLRHGADHTVTTKKGDTALSILVEQNLIDAAAEMVTEYNASILRCSRDRKKVQRARLLINLKLKQMERDKEQTSTDDDSECSVAHVAQHLTASTSDDDGKSAEEKAREAEEALLLELEKEDEKAKQEEAKANYKQAKKKKKRERERQQKLQEEEARRLRNEEQEKEREQQQKEKSEKERKEREDREKAEQEKVFLEREKVMAAKRKERELRESKKESEKRYTVSPDGSKSSLQEKREKSDPGSLARAATDPTPSRKIFSPKTSTKPVTPLGGNRRWETAAQPPQLDSSPPVIVKSIESAHQHNPIPTLPQSAVKREKEAESPSMILSPRSNGEKRVTLDQQSPRTPLSVTSEHSQSFNGLHSPSNERSQEHPALPVFRQEKVLEMCRRSSQVLSLVSSQTFKRVIYRWILRASHFTMESLDPIIPSWVNHNHLVDYFQRQFIAESRRSGVAPGGQNMEALKEAGMWVTKLCLGLAEEVAKFSQLSEVQLPNDWTDTSVNITAKSALRDNGTVVVITWNNQVSVEIADRVVLALRDRFVGPADRFLTSLFVSKTMHDTVQFIVSETGIQLSLPQRTQTALFNELEVTGDLCSNPFSVGKNNVFWGQLEPVDGMFGGLTPFGNDTGAADHILFGHGGSFVAFLPGDTLVAGHFVKRVVDVLDGAETARFPLSFALFLTTDCFPERSSSLAASDLFALDGRLGHQLSKYVSRIEHLKAGDHAYCSLDGKPGSKLTSTDSIFVVLQNAMGRSRFVVNDGCVARIVSTLSLGVRADSHIPGPYPVDFRGSPLTDPFSAYVDGFDPISPDPQRAATARVDFGAIGDVASISSHFSPTNERGPRCGRLFDLVDNADDEQLADDIVHGMLNTLDVGFFQDVNVPADNVDIEAISLGIGGLPSHPDRPGPFG